MSFKHRLQWSAENHHFIDYVYIYDISVSQVNRSLRAPQLIFMPGGTATAAVATVSQQQPPQQQQQQQEVPPTSSCNQSDNDQVRFVTPPPPPQTLHIL